MFVKQHRTNQIETGQVVALVGSLLIIAAMWFVVETIWDDEYISKREKQLWTVLVLTTFVAGLVWLLFVKDRTHLR